MVLKYACIKNNYGGKHWAPLLVYEQKLTFSIPAPTTILQDPYAKPKLLNHQSYPFFLCFICIINSNFPLAIFICHRAIHAGIKAPEWISSGSQQWSKLWPVKALPVPEQKKIMKLSRAQKRNHAIAHAFSSWTVWSLCGSAEHCNNGQVYRHKHNHKIPTIGVTNLPEDVTTVTTAGA